MKQVSKPNTSPLIMECKKCGHREYAEIQVPPPWGTDKKGAAPPPQEEDAIEPESKERSRCEPHGTPVTVGDPDEDTVVIPFGWLLIGGVFILAAIVWALSC
jgi:hypothetical protein